MRSHQPVRGLCYLPMHLKFACVAILWITRLTDSLFSSEHCRYFPRCSIPNFINNVNISPQHCVSLFQFRDQQNGETKVMSLRFLSPFQRSEAIPQNHSLLQTFSPCPRVYTLYWEKIWAPPRLKLRWSLRILLSDSRKRLFTEESSWQRGWFLAKDHNLFLQLCKYWFLENGRSPKLSSHPNWERSDQNAKIKPPKQKETKASGKHAGRQL